MKRNVAARHRRRTGFAMAFVAPAFVATIAATALWQTTALAQEEAANDLDEVITSATRIETTVRELARSASVVDKDRIQNGTQQLALDEALAGVPGLYMQNRYNFAQDLRVSMRGFGARSAFGIRGIKIIVDGIPETLPDGQGGVDSIDLGSAERIEVLRGPSSSLYGNASGGVIAIQTERGPETPFVEGTVAAGSYDYQKYQLKAGGQRGRVDYLFNVSAQEIDGYRDNARAEGRLFNSKIGVQLNETDSLTFALNYTDQPTSDDPGGINAAQVAADRRSARDNNLLFASGEALDQQRIGAVYQRNRASGNLTLRNYYVWRDFENRLPFQGGGAVNIDRFYYGFGALYSLGESLPEAANLAFGFDIDRQDDERRRFDNLQGVRGPLVFDQREKVDSNGLFARGDYQLNDRWTLTAGLRYDEITFDVGDRFIANGDDSGDLSFDHWSPSIGLSVDTDAGVVFANYSNSFETPTTTELANPDGSGGFNANLEPQIADNFELGFKTGSDRLFFEFAVFSIDLNDELVPFEVATAPGRTFFANAGESSRTGVETAVSWNHESGFGVDASFTWSDFTFDDFLDANGNDFAGNQLPGLPEQFGYLALRYQNQNGLNAVFETSYSGDLYANNANTVNVPSYVISGLRISYEFERGTWLYRPYFGVNNIFDEKYNSNIRINAFGARYFEPAPERNIYAGITVRFGA